jgi:hypothetical protein
MKIHVAGSLPEDTFNLLHLRSHLALVPLVASPGNSLYNSKLIIYCGVETEFYIRPPDVPEQQYRKESQTTLLATEIRNCF